MNFKEQILQGIPEHLPAPKKYNKKIDHAPVRADVLNDDEKKLSVRNALRYFPTEWHKELAPEFFNELETFGRIYMYRFMPDYEIYARSIEEYPFKSLHAGCIMLMIHNNLDPAVAQHPQELITYGGNGGVFQNWAQYLLTMKYLATMTDEQTLNIYSGHPQGIFPSSASAPRVVVSNGMMIPNYSSKADLEKFSALGVTQYGQMTAGSYMYIGPQGIVHGTAITLMNAFRKKLSHGEKAQGKIFLTAGLGGMSGAQTKAGNIAGCITVCAEINPSAAKKRHSQGWVDELIESLDELVDRVNLAQRDKETVSLAYIGNVVEVWERFDKENIFVQIGSDQTSLHNPFSGGYYPVGLSFEEANRMIAEDPDQFKKYVQESLVRQVKAINAHTGKGTYFFDYGNAFLLECSRAGADIMTTDGTHFRYPSYVQDILGPMCFDYGFGPFRWVCASGKQEDLRITDQIAKEVMQEIKANAPEEIQQQLEDNILWITEAESNALVVGSQARILYADAEGRAKIATKFNEAVASGKLSAPVILGRDHHDVSGTDSPFRETSNIYDGSRFTADMAIHNVIGDSFRGATWVSVHNGGGVGWGEVINGGFGMVLDGTDTATVKLKDMLFFDVNNGIARRSWARNEEAIFAIQREMERTPSLTITLPYRINEDVLS
ncbi:urocanate hydratase [Chryseobacterium sp. G0186]|uniref:urocanate hydratase n=1 Tax=Chryseobacterium sp. G0186 TaxID=2487064 RepID=UPI000F4F50DB|nr:urocanate hydratase [Chryseobacterium sp. G0186]AZA77294.1 urocanate hydratase [Chryseobacterium sp. G0186]